MFLVILALVVGAVMFGRVLLIAAGLYKDPVLHSFQRYAYMDDTYLIYIPFLLWLGVLSLAAGWLYTMALAPRFPPFTFGVVLLVLTYFAFQHREWIARRNWLILLPRWYVELRERTTREERRRIAYMWLALPLRTRLRLSASDHHFRMWADLVILCTVTQTVTDEEALMRRHEPQYDPLG